LCWDFEVEVEVEVAPVVGCMLARPTPAPTAAPTNSDALTIISHIFQVTLMICISKPDLETVVTELMRLNP
jgi:hypothetical protein